MIKFFNPAKRYLKIKDEIDLEIQRVLGSGDLILRSDVEKFEENLANYVGTKYAIGLNSGTDALYLALRYLGIGHGDEVLVPSYTFVATAQVVNQLGAIPVLYDFQGSIPLTINTRAIIPAHLEGKFDIRFEEIWKWGLSIPIIEDACQALGATRQGKTAGSFGFAGAFSFYPAKILGAYGDAGSLVTNDETLYNWAKEARNHFKTEGKDWGINSRMDNVQAAILNVKFKYLSETLLIRSMIAQKYLRELNDLSIGLPLNTEGRVWQDFVIHVGEKRDELYGYLKEKGIETLKNNYPFPIPKQPISQRYENESLRIPCNETLEDSEIGDIIKTIRNFYGK